LLASAGHPFKSYDTFIHQVADSCLNDDDRYGNPSIPATMSDKMMAARKRRTTFWRSFENWIPKKKTTVATDHIERNPIQKKSVGSNLFHKRRNHSSSSSSSS
jgi:hypothetical protein